MERWQGRTALVTGASAGIGAALVRALVTGGMNVVAAARNMQRLEALRDELKSAPGTVLPVQCDLRDKVAIDNVFSAAKDKFGGVDVCINNAGLGHNAPLMSGDTEEWRELFEVNVLALAICTRETIKSMQDRGVNDGHIIHISSMSGHRIETPGMGHFYAGTKHAVKAMTEGLRRELRTAKSMTRVTAISPGNVETEFSARMFAYDKKLQAEMVNSPFKELQAADIVNSVMFALTAPEHCQIQDILIRPLEQVE